MQAQRAVRRTKVKRSAETRLRVGGDRDVEWFSPQDRNERVARSSPVAEGESPSYCVLIHTI